MNVNFYLKTLVLLFLLVILVVSCEETFPSEPGEDELLDGPISGLTLEEERQFLAGDIAFNDDIFTVSKGLGPIFVANSCGSCHAGDGKGHPFISFTRFGQPDTLGNQFLHLGGPQLQHKAIPGFAPELIPPGATSTKLLAPAVTGLGLLDAVSDADLIDLSDPNDENGDGISGVPNWNNIPSYVRLRPNAISKKGKYISRFGKKAGAYDLLQQTAGAYNQDMGITSDFEPVDPYSQEVSDPEVSNQTIHNVVFYLKTLKAPIQRNQSDARVIKGRDIFKNIQCANCHIPTLSTSESDITALSFKEFHPYTDMLLHDMGPGLDDKYTEGFALTSEWRTPPLWGLGLSKDAQGGSYFLMHDGRAESIEEAIMLHGGEAQQSKENYNNLSQSDKDLLLTFLESL